MEISVISWEEDRPTQPYLLKIIKINGTVTDVLRFCRRSLGAHSQSLSVYWFQTQGELCTETMIIPG